MILGSIYRRRTTILAVIFAIIFAHTPAIGGELMSERPEVKLSGAQLSAVATALVEFNTRGYSLENYTIAIRENPTQYEVVFVPNHPSDEPTVRGGRTSHGREIHYLITRYGKIAKISYAK